MFLENLVVDAVDPPRLGRFWESALAGRRLTDGVDIFEMTVGAEGGPGINLCFQPVPAPATTSPRLRPDLAGGEHRADLVDRLLGLGAHSLRSDDDRTLLADPEGNQFCVIDTEVAYAGTELLVTLPLELADPPRDATFWAWLTGWSSVPARSAGSRALRHPSLQGLILELVPESAPKGAVKNRLHLDLRLEVDDDHAAIVAALTARGGQPFAPGWGDLPWRSYLAPSGNEFCLLPAPS